MVEKEFRERKRSEGKGTEMYFKIHLIDGDYLVFVHRSMWYVSYGYLIVFRWCVSSAYYVYFPIEITKYFIFVTSRTVYLTLGNIILDLNGTSSTMNTNGSHGVQEKIALQKDRMSYVLWKRPFGTLYYFLLESYELLWELSAK